MMKFSVSQMISQCCETVRWFPQTEQKMVMKGYTHKGEASTLEHIQDAYDEAVNNKTDLVKAVIKIK